MINSSSKGTSITRERTNSASGYYPLSDLTFDRKASNPPPLHDYTGYPQTVDANGYAYSLERIAYDTGSAFFKNCVHDVVIRATADPSDRLEFILYTAHSPNNYYHQYKIPSFLYTLKSLTGVPGNPDSGGTAMPSIDLDGLDAALSRAYKSMLPRIEDITGGTNFINFCLELKDMKQMFSLWKKSFGVLKNLSAGILNVSYAWQPFISDLQQISRGILRLEDYLNRWNDDLSLV